MGARGTFRFDPPRLRTGADPGEAERHATWFELFFDLVFVAAVSQLGVALARDPSAAVYGRFAALFAIVLWAWVLYALYANRFDTDDLIFRMAKCGAMLAIAAAAVNLHQVMQGRGCLYRAARAPHRLVHPGPPLRRGERPVPEHHLHPRLLLDDAGVADLDLRPGAAARPPSWSPRSSDPPAARAHVTAPASSCTPRSIAGSAIEAWPRTSPGGQSPV